MLYVGKRLMVSTYTTTVTNFFSQDDETSTCFIGFKTMAQSNNHTLVILTGNRPRSCYLVHHATSSLQNPCIDGFREES